MQASKRQAPQGTSNKVHTYCHTAIIYDYKLEISTILLLSFVYYKPEQTQWQVFVSYLNKCPFRRTENPDNVPIGRITYHIFLHGASEVLTERKN